MEHSLKRSFAALLAVLAALFAALPGSAESSSDSLVDQICELIEGALENGDFCAFELEDYVKPDNQLEFEFTVPPHIECCNDSDMHKKVCIELTLYTSADASGPMRMEVCNFVLIDDQDEMLFPTQIYSANGVGLKEYDFPYPISRRGVDQILLAYQVPVETSEFILVNTNILDGTFQGMLYAALFSFSDLDFFLNNESGVEVSEVYVAPSKDTTWGSARFSGTLSDGESSMIEFDEDEACLSDNWDFRVVFSDGSDAVWQAISPSKFRNVCEVMLTKNNDGTYKFTWGEG